MMKVLSVEMLCQKAPLNGTAAPHGDQAGLGAAVQVHGGYFSVHLVAVFNNVQQLRLGYGLAQQVALAGLKPGYVFECGMGSEKRNANLLSQAGQGALANRRCAMLPHAQLRRRRL